MTGTIVAASIVFFPAAPLFLFMKGKDVTIPKGTEITAYVNSDIKLDIAKFQGSSSNPSQIASEKSSGPLMTNIDAMRLRNAGFSDELIVERSMHLLSHSIWMLTA